MVKVLSMDLLKHAGRRSERQRPLLTRLSSGMELVLL